jgi:hypothetical protein
MALLFLHNAVGIATYVRTVLLHDAQKLDDDLGAGSDENLTLAGLLGIVNALESVVEDGCLDHFDGSVMRFSSREIRGLEVSAKRIFC